MRKLVARGLVSIFIFVNILNSFSVSALAEVDVIKVKIMDPFDTTKPLTNGAVSIKGDSTNYTTDKDGCVNLPRKNLQQDSSILIKTDIGSSISVFSAKIDVSNSSASISTSNASLSKINIRPYMSKQYAVDISNMNIEIYNVDNYDNIKAKLDLHGEKILYTNLDIKGAIVSGNNAFLTTTYSGSGDFLINNYDVFSIEVSMLAEAGDDLRMLSIMRTPVVTRLVIGDYHIKASGSYTLSRGNYMYDYTAQKYLYTGEINSLNSTKPELKFGTDFKASIQYEDKSNADEVNVDETITSKLIMKDEYENDVHPLLDTPAAYSALINGNDSSDALVTVSSGDTYKVKIGRRDNTEDFSFSLKAVIDNKQYITNNLIYKYNKSTNRKKIIVKDPEGNPMKKGSIENSSVSSINGTTIENGEMYIDQEVLKAGVKDVSIYGTNLKGEGIIYSGISIGTDTNEIFINNEKRVYIKDNIQASTGRLSFRVYSKSKDRSNKPSYVEDFNQKQDYMDKFYNKYVWLPSDTSVISLYYRYYNNETSNSYFLADKISDSNSVNLDCTKTTRLDVEGSNNEGAKLSYKIDDSYLVNTGDDFDTTTRNVTSDICEGYDLNLGAPTEGLVYNKELTDKISGSVYSIKIGSSFNINANYKESNLISKDKVGKASINITDEYNNKVSLKRFVYDSGQEPNDLIELSQSGEAVEEVKSELDIEQTPYEMDFTTKTQGGYLDAVFKVKIFGKMYSSNILTFDNTGIKSYTVKAPNGSLIESGEVALKDGSKYKISSGKAIIPSDKALDKTLSIWGVTKDGEYVFNPKFPVNGDDSNFNLVGNRKTIITDAIEGSTNGELRVYCSDQYNDNYIDEKWDISNLKSISNLKVWVQPGINYRVSNFINTSGDYQYLLTTVFGEGPSNINLSTNKLVELKLSSNYPKKDISIDLQQDDVQTIKTSLNMVKKTFITENQFKCLVASYVDENDSAKNINYQLADKEIIKGKQHTIFLGSNFKPYINYSNNKVLFYGDMIVALGKGLRDEYNNYRSVNVKNSRVELEFIDGAGKTVITSDRFTLIWTLPSSIPTGKYSVRTNLYVNDEKVFSSITNDIYVAGSGAVKISSSPYSYSVKVNDGGSLIYSNSSNNNGDIYVPNYLLQNGKNYNYSLLKVNDGVIEHVKSDFIFNEGNQTNVNTKASVGIKVSSNVKKIILKTDDGQSIDYDIADHENKSITLNLIEGQQYELLAYCKDDDSSYWSKNIVKAGKSLSELNFNKNNLKKLSLTNNFNSDIEVIGCTAKETSTGQIYYIGRNLIQGNSFYLPEGKYDLNFKIKLNEVNSLAEYNKNIDLTTADGSINVGDKLSYDFILDKTKYSAGDKISAKLNNVRDGDVKLADYENMVIDPSSIKINLMHGLKSLKSFEKEIPSNIKGDCTIVVKGNVLGLGEVFSKPTNVYINNSGIIKEGDINLDGVIDIFDLVYISRDFGKYKGQSDYDPRINLSDYDNVIDIKDLAKAASNYEN